MTHPDWDTIKRKYIEGCPNPETGEHHYPSLRKLATLCPNTSFSAIKEHCRKENWVQLREQFKTKLNTNIQNQTIISLTDQFSTAQNKVMDALMETIILTNNKLKDPNLTAYEIKALTQTLNITVQSLHLLLGKPTQVSEVTQTTLEAEISNEYIPKELRKQARELEKKLQEAQNSPNSGN